MKKKETIMWAIVWKDSGDIVKNISGIDWIDGHLLIYDSRNHAREVKTSNNKIVKVKVTIVD